MTITMCNDCKKKSIVATADMGGRFNCMICSKLQTGVSSIGHGKVCFDCERLGYCKWCGKKVDNLNQEDFLKELKELFERFVKDIPLNNLLNSADLYIDTVKKEIK